MKKDKDLYSSSSSERGGGDIVFRNVNGNPHTPIDPETGEVAFDKLKSTSQDNVVEVDMSAEVQKQLSAAQTPKERQEIAFRYIMDNLRGRYPMNDGRIVAVERVGADKMAHSYDERKIRVLPELKKLIDAGRLRGVIDVQHRLFAQIAYYDVEFRINNERYKARLNVGIRSNGDSTLYDIKPIEQAKK